MFHIINIGVAKTRTGLRRSLQIPWWSGWIIALSAHAATFNIYIRYSFQSGRLNRINLRSLLGSVERHLAVIVLAIQLGQLSMGRHTSHSAGVAAGMEAEACQRLATLRIPLG